MSLKVLKNAMKNALRDDFEEGTVIRWTMFFPDARPHIADKSYLYAAVKANGSWFTTAQPISTTVEQDENWHFYGGGLLPNSAEIRTTTTNVYGHRVPPKVSFEGLVKILTGEHAQDVAVSSTWETL